MTRADSAGLALKPEHFDRALAAPADGLWFEVHPENYMVSGGPRLAWLDAIAARHPLSLHGVGLSLAAAAPPDPRHLGRLRELVSRYRPARVSEHLAWSAWRGTYHPDLLPVPRTGEALQQVVDNVGRTQDALGMPIAIENPSHYVQLRGHEMPEVEFLAELARRSGCGLVLDVNNAFVSSHNIGGSVEAYVDAFPAGAIVEVHLAGHRRDPVQGTELLIDSHDAPVAEPVWALYERLIARAGPRPTLVERDSNLPSFDELMAERSRALRILHPAVEEVA